MTVANIVYKYRLYPNAEQQVLFAKTFGCCLKIWNLILADRNEAYQKDKTHIASTPACYKKEYPLWMKTLVKKMMIKEKRNY